MLPSICADSSTVATLQLLHRSCTSFASLKHGVLLAAEVLPVLYHPLAREARASGIRLPRDLPLPTHELTGTVRA